MNSASNTEQTYPAQADAPTAQPTLPELMSQLTAVTAQLAESLASLNAEVGRLREHVEAHEGNQGVLDKRLVAAEDALSAVEDGLAHVNTGFSEKLHQQRRCRIR